MIGLLLVVSGIALAVGAKDIAGRLAKGFIGVVLVVTGLPYLLQACVCALGERGRGDIEFPLGNIAGIVVLVAFSAGSLYLWRLRTHRARMRDLWEKRNGAPRARALPLPPPTTK